MWQLILALTLAAALLPGATARGDFFTPETIQRFAPLLVLHSQEDNGPASAQWFVDRSDLLFSESAPCSNEVLYPGPWSPATTAKLGLLVPSVNRWRHRTKEFPLCHHGGVSFISTDYTRPYTSGRSDLLKPVEGFYLDFNQGQGGMRGMPFKIDRSHEIKTEATVYYDDGELVNSDGSAKRPRQAYISYWFFYAYNDAPPVHLLWNHEGDWENMSLLFQESSDHSHWKLERVAYSAHGDPREYSAACSAAVYASDPLRCATPRTVWKGEQRLVGFVAGGDHATYPSPGPHHLPFPGVKDHASSIEAGYSWPTWKTLLPLESQGWAGFCGGWGQVGNSILGFGIAWVNDRTGPLGPGCLDDHNRHRKSGRPKSWGISISSPVDREAKPGEAVGLDAPVEGSSAG